MRFRTIEIISLVTFSMIAMVLTLVICDRDYSNALVKKYSESRGDIIYQVSEKITQTYKGAHTLSNSYFYSDYLDTIAEASPNYLEQNMITFNGNMKTLDMTAMNLMLAYDFEYYIVIKFDNGYSYISRNRYLSEYDYDQWESEEWSEAWTFNEGKLSLSGPYEDFLGDESEQIIVFGRTFFGAYQIKKGFLLVCIPETEFAKAYETVAECSDIFLLDSEGKIISSNNKDYLTYDYSSVFSEASEGKIVSDEKEYLVTSCQDEETGITVIEHYPYENIVSAVGEVHGHVVVAALLIGGCILAFSIIYADIVSRKLRRLSEEVEAVGEENLDVHFSGEGWYEISQIAFALSSMQTRIKNLIRETKEKEKKKRKAEISYLQLQINPHVIYNTIFCAKCLVDLKKNKEASNMLSDFISYLRWMFNSSGKLLTVLEAKEHLDQYINIMKYRYTDNFDVIYDMQEETKEAYMINMLLQPIVENAILHGIAPSEKRCRIVIRSERQGDMLLLTISNDGVVMTRDALQKYEKQLQDEEQNHGMNNVIRRLKTAYEGNFDLKITSDESETRVTIRIPYIIADNLEEIE